MSAFIRRFERNLAGRDLIVGDVHGCFTKLKAALDAVGFDRAADRLFSVGDLIDRGPESDEVLEWIGHPWFHAVMGNHEQMAVMFHVGDCDAGMYGYNGGHWFIGMQPEQRFGYASAFFDLPLVIELETEAGLLGIVHAACDMPSWPAFVEALADPRADGVRENAVWGRNRPMGQDFGPVVGVRAVVVGHTPMERMTSLDNVLYIDTGGWLQGGTTNRPITVIDAATLELAQRPAKPETSGSRGIREVEGRAMTAVIEASSVRLNTMADGTLRITCDIEPRHAQDAFKLFGSPGTPMALAALKIGQALPESDVTGIPATEKPKGGHLSQDAARICRTVPFRAFVETEFNQQCCNETEAAEFVRHYCAIGSRAELDHDPRAARLFSALMTQYREQAA